MSAQDTLIIAWKWNGYISCLKNVWSVRGSIVGRFMSTLLFWDKCWIVFDVDRFADLKTLKSTTLQSQSSSESTSNMHLSIPYTPFTRYNRLSNGFDSRVERTAVRPTAVCQTGCQRVWQPVECLYTRYNRLSKTSLTKNQFDNLLTTGLITGCIVYTDIYPVIKPGNNRLCRVNGALL